MTRSAGMDRQTLRDARGGRLFGQPLEAIGEPAERPSAACARDTQSGRDTGSRSTPRADPSFESGILIEPLLLPARSGRSRRPRHARATIDESLHVKAPSLTFRRSAFAVFSKDPPIVGLATM